MTSGECRIHDFVMYPCDTVVAIRTALGEGRSDPTRCRRTRRLFSLRNVDAVLDPGYITPTCTDCAGRPYGVRREY